MSCIIDTTGFNRQQWEIFYQIKKLEWERDKEKDRVDRMYPMGNAPNSARSDMVRISFRIKRARAALIEISAAKENAREEALWY